MTEKAAAHTLVMRFGELEIDVLHRRARIDGRDLHLTSLELSLLFLLATNPGLTLTRDEILDHLWGGEYAAESNVVDRHVRNLRAKLQDDWRRPRFIATVPGQGYRFVLAVDNAQVTPQSSGPAPRGSTSPWSAQTAPPRPNEENFMTGGARCETFDASDDSV